MTTKGFYITTTLPYVNAEPHIGFAMEIIRADIIARYHQLAGQSVFFNTGTDEHGQKIYEKALASGEDVQAYVDRLVGSFKDLISLLDIWPEIHFIRTTDPAHIKAAQEFWRRCDQGGYIYKKAYETKYCVGCELAKTDSELVDGRCSIHPDREVERQSEENYFFKFSALADELNKLYQERPDFVVPYFRFNEIKSFLAGGLQDFSVSRLKAKMPWGVPVPGDDEHVFYVWFDALVNYVSALGWPASAKAPAGTAPEEGEFDRWWPVVQYAGKDNLRQQAAMWQAMLLAAGLPPSRQIIINGFINAADGQKMSKSVGNTVSPVDLVTRFGADGLRYYVARHISDFEDHDFSLEKMTEAYNAGLANGLGNLLSRVMKMAATHLESPVPLVARELPADYEGALANFRINRATDIVWEHIARLDRQIQSTEPFKLIKTDPEAAKAIIAELVSGLALIGYMLEPIMPATAATISNLVAKNAMPATPLFARLD